MPAASKPDDASAADKAAPAAKPIPTGPSAASKPAAPQAPSGPRAAQPTPSSSSAAPQIALMPLPTAPTSSVLSQNTAQTNLDKIERALGEMSVSRGGRGPATLSSNSRQHSNTAPQQQQQQQVQQPRNKQRQPRPPQQQQQQQAAPVSVPDSEFDFEAGNKKFDRASLAKEAGQVLVENESDDSSDEEEFSTAPQDRRTSSASGQKDAFYNKSTSFFDSISSDLRPDFASTSRGGRAPRGSGVVRGRVWRDEERVKNLDTFGEVGDGLNGNGLGYGGRGRGGRRGGGGRGPRGGYSNQQGGQQHQQQ